MYTSDMPSSCSRPGTRPLLGFPMSQAWWLMHLFPELRGQKQANLRIGGQPGLHRELQDDRVIRPYLKTGAS